MWWLDFHFLLLGSPFIVFLLLIGSSSVKESFLFGSTSNMLTCCNLLAARRFKEKLCYANTSSSPMHVVSGM